MFKKALSLSLAVLFILSMATSAMAEENHISDTKVVSSSVIIDPMRPVPTVQIPSKAVKYTVLTSSIRQYTETNSDVKGWLKIPGTNIDTPVVQASRQQGNNYYNERDWKGTQHTGYVYPDYAITSTYMDVRTTFGKTWRSTSRNIVIYGHNWTNLRMPYDVGAEFIQHDMFAQLPSYADVNFATKNPYIYFSTENYEGIWKVFAVATCEVTPDFQYNNPGMTESELKNIIAEWKDRSYYDFSTEVDEKDRIITLSTCTREIAGVGAKQRFVVVARLLRENETDEDPVVVTLNSDRKKPVFN